MRNSNQLLMCVYAVNVMCPEEPVPLLRAPQSDQSGVPLVNLQRLYGHGRLFCGGIKNGLDQIVWTAVTNCVSEQDHNWIAP